MAAVQEADALADASRREDVEVKAAAATKEAMAVNVHITSQLHDCMIDCMIVQWFSFVMCSLAWTRPDDAFMKSATLSVGVSSLEE